MRVKYFLSYDLIKEKNYQVLYDELENFDAIRVLESVWCFKYEENSAEALRDHFKQYIDKNDRLLVIQSADWASIRLLADPNKVK